VGEQAVIADADAQAAKERVEQKANAYGCPVRMPNRTQGSQMNGEETGGFDWTKLIADGNRRRG
jgi:hypothetical protein